MGRRCPTKLKPLRSLRARVVVELRHGGRIPRRSIVYRHRRGHWLAETLIYSGKPEGALRVAETAVRLDPRNQRDYFVEVGWAYHLMDRYEEAITAMKGVLTSSPNHLAAHVILTVCYSELGREAEAQAAAAEVQRISPDFSLERVRQRNPHKDQTRLERRLAALRKVGLK